MNNQSRPTSFRTLSSYNREIQGEMNPRSLIEEANIEKAKACHHIYIKQYARKRLLKEKKH